MFRFCLLLGLACLVTADLPIDCRYSDAVGTWAIQETNRDGDATLDCSSLTEIIHTNEFTLSFPNVVTDILGNTGTWTMIYNQGFEVNINGRSYWTPFYYDLDASQFDCTSLYQGWSRDDTVRNWACFTGSKISNLKSSGLRKFVSPKSTLQNQKFVNDRVFIDRLNAAQNSWTAKAYPEHEQYTVKEMLQRGGVSYSPLPPTAPATEEQKQRASMLPTYFDWRDIDGVNYVSDVRNQLSCGSCFAFASAGILEARLRIITQNARQDVFSTQDVVSCTDLAEGCLGGFAYLIAGRYGKDKGFVAEECNTYSGTDIPCTTDTTCGRTYVSDYEYIGGYYGACNEQIMMETLIARGPLSVDFNVESDFYSYSSGVYSHVPTVKADFDPLYVVNHAVLVVGYGVEESTGEKYWIVKNSWGATWGEDGYFRILRGTNEVGIESAAVDVTVIP